VPYLKKGVESWQVAFEAAGFRNAVIAKEAPSATEDPDWSPEDARYSVIRWLPSTIENASGPHVHDPRTGEILETDIQFYHNVMNLARNWYFVQVGALDPRAKTLPLPDDLMGRLIEYVAAHEVGHTLVFQHNMKASSMYPAARVRDAKWVKENGHTATLMDYSRFNYVAQPEGKIAVEDLVPKIGPYDKWATMWGYKPIPGATSPAAEKKALDEWARQQDATPWLRFSTEGSAGSDPGELTEAVGDEDAVASTTLGMKNLEQSAIDGTAAYDPLDFLADVRRGSWSELYAGGSVPIDAYRRNLQRAYVDTLSNRINGAQAQSDDARAFFRGELKTLDRDLEGALGRQTDRATTLHMQDVRMQIARALDPTYQAAASRTTTELTDYFDVSIEPESCWVDYAITPKRTKRR
jgi:hypothetical protein